MKPDPYHYTVIKRAITFLNETQNQQPNLKEVASAVGLSPAHFQRTFHQWVGVTPKKYQQYLTLNHAKFLLKNRFTLLKTTHETGLSSSSRLHDLFINWEAMSPGDFVKRGADLNIYYHWYDTIFGSTLIMGTARGVCGLAFESSKSKIAVLNDMSSRWPCANFIQDKNILTPIIGGLFDFNSSIKIQMMGTSLQLKVWQALLEIPSGNVTTYSEVANHIGKPKAVRAVATAIGKNPISWLIPCHRVLQKSGGIGGYHWGLTMKTSLLAWEAARFDSRK